MWVSKLAALGGSKKLLVRLTEGLKVNVPIFAPVTRLEESAAAHHSFMRPF